MRKRPSKMPLVVLAFLAIVATIVAFVGWFVTRNQETTDDAFTDGNVVTIAPAVSGYVVQLLVKDNGWVSKGEVLVKIDPRDYRHAYEQISAQLGAAQAQLSAAQIQLRLARAQYPAQLSQARAQQQSALANLANARAAYRRQRSVNAQATTAQNIDIAATQKRDAAAVLNGALAQVRMADLVPQQIALAEAAVQARTDQLKAVQAQLDQARLNLSRTQIKAPCDGWVTRRNIQLGGFAQAGAPLFALVTPDVWITANFKESQIGRMHPGDKVDITVDAFPHLTLRGHVDSIQLGTGARFSAFPAENATGNFVKILQRVPVKIAIDSGLDRRRPLAIGLSVEPTVELR